MSYSDVQVRLSAFSWLEEQVEVHGEVLPWRVLSKGFVYGDTRVPLLSQQGIFKPAVCELPLSIRTLPDGPTPTSSRPTASSTTSTAERSADRGLTEIAAI